MIMLYLIGARAVHNVTTRDYLYPRHEQNIGSIH